ncbi:MULTISPECIES: peptidoglycan DD-metalloendopeptidase family protein [unclassified Acidovorax]|uniref:peptidoglycan DD-metalloendopeptidase family protein n=1 Tax=unclassified Acidovorax TaxID=2684926 RepID=UPI00234BCBF7|nr:MULTISPECIES: peptidoglycan DD-metalloendopeptidase family protein [unclassified Acidovorax]WCM99224.1 peptidoglycan DD-metalloendopeptidase family protein [Acidovorax sp. GBBC 1281]
MLVTRGLVGWGSVALAALVLTGCGTRVNRAPVEDRGTSASTSASQPGMVVAPAAKPLPGAENAGKPGYYTVKPGDTLIRIGLENGQSWKDIARWNNLDNANLIEVGQVLRVAAPSATPAPSVASDTGVVTRPVTSSAIAPATPASGAKPGASAPAVAAAPAPAPSPAPAATGGEDDMAFIWPSSGSLVAGFDEARNKGYDIGGKAGDPVLASADGRVVYAGAGLRGYGNLVILKHNNTYLTAYAHNQTLLVKEDQTVRRGQKIAEMGSSDTDRVKLHFEIRRQGKPVDPSRYLPAR